MSLSVVRREAVELLCAAQADGRISDRLFEERLAAVQGATSDAGVLAIVWPPLARSWRRTAAIVHEPAQVECRSKCIKQLVTAQPLRAIRLKRQLFVISPSTAFALIGLGGYDRLIQPLHVVATLCKRRR